MSRSHVDFQRDIDDGVDWLDRRKEVRGRRREGERKGKKGDGQRKIQSQVP